MNFQFIIAKEEKKKENIRGSHSNIPSFDERGFNERGERLSKTQIKFLSGTSFIRYQILPLNCRFRYRTTRSASSATSPQPQSVGFHVQNRVINSDVRRRPSVAWGEEQSVRRHTRRSRNKVKGIEKRRSLYFLFLTYFMSVVFFSL